MKYYYGLRDKKHLSDCVEKAVRVFGGGYRANALVMETSAAETHCGTFPDRHEKTLGVGLTQFDQIGLDDLIMRVRSKDRKKLSQYYDVDLDMVKLADLAYNPELACALTRLKYKLRPEPIPPTLEGRAKYWKRFYNSVYGDGTPEEYIERVEEFLP
ncbi:hypothetical protein B8b_026 [Pseudoalteromonas phage B8b]|uniref:Uncharacterized protein n=1 Tax=Pseudoalteromonas phage B8b TaxID=1506997 RepID=A0A076G7K9_9CAUD|nr:hypothetical protein B8b_026 [Pseudoalteromonas phage B8b]|tara:strand:+ start:77 stop:547 length:471 start_codon:yes stop_codon:yes gene_type:complete